MVIMRNNDVHFVFFRYFSPLITGFCFSNISEININYRGNMFEICFKCGRSIFGLGVVSVSYIAIVCDKCSHRLFIKPSWLCEAD